MNNYRLIKLIHKDWYLHRHLLLPLIIGVTICALLIVFLGEYTWPYVTQLSLFILVAATATVAPRLHDEGKEKTFLFSMTAPVSSMDFSISKFLSCYLPYIFIYTLTSFVFYRMGIICEASDQAKALWQLTLMIVFCIFSTLYCFNAVTKSLGLGYTIAAGALIAIVIYTSIFFSVENDLIPEDDIYIWSPLYYKLMFVFGIYNIALISFTYFWRLNHQDIA